MNNSKRFHPKKHCGPDPIINAVEEQRHVVCKLFRTLLYKDLGMKLVVIEIMEWNVRKQYNGLPNYKNENHIRRSQK